MEKISGRYSPDTPLEVSENVQITPLDESKFENLANALSTGYELLIRDIKMEYILVDSSTMSLAVAAHFT